jgi:hypothetical protein
VHFREIFLGYFLFSRFDWSIFITQLVARHMKEIIKVILNTNVLCFLRYLDDIGIIQNVFKNT